jgi:hypothetical protein
MQLGDMAKDKATPFALGTRIKMSITPMILMLVLPWGAFVLTCSLSAFKTRYLFPGLVNAACVAFVLFWLASIPTAIWARLKHPEPTWYSYLALTLGIAVITGPLCGDWIFKSLMEPYYRVMDLKVLKDVDITSTRGDTLMDAGIVDFTRGNKLDGMKSWHFKHHTTYCVAPIVSNRTDGPPTGSYDFWAVGKDCCSLTASDFRCGAWGHPHSNKAIRALSDEDLPFYRLAVQQAETLYGVVAAHPVFFKWSVEPEIEVASWEHKGFMNFLFCICTALVASLLTLGCAVWRFSFLGRKRHQSDLIAWNGQPSYGI